MVAGLAFLFLFAAIFSRSFSFSLFCLCVFCSDLLFD
jgi:hypothetical protein